MSDPYILGNYANLETYAVLSGTYLLSTNTLIVANGYYAAGGGLFDVSITPEGSPSGVNDASASYALAELTNLTGPFDALLNNTVGFPIFTIPLTDVTTDITLQPYNFANMSTDLYVYVGSDISFNGGNITLDASGDPAAYFFICASGNIVFNNVPSISLINGGSICNVFWYAQNSIYFTGTLPPSVPGVFISGNQITLDQNTNITGRLYTKTGLSLISFNGTTGNTTVNATYCGIPGPGPTPIGNVCFVGDTPITTDQGIVLIRDMDPAKHTLRGEKIVAITKTKTWEDSLVCFERHALAKNIPSRRTILSQQHKVFYKGSMREAVRCIGRMDPKKVYKVPYQGQILYNILMEHPRLVCANNLICETLHPDNIIAKLYTHPRMPALVADMNHAMDTNNVYKYSKAVYQIKHT